MLSSSKQFSDFVDDYFHAYFAFTPSEGTAAGFHEYDAKLEDFSAGAFHEFIQTLKSLAGRLETLRSLALSEDDLIDAEILHGAIMAQLLEMETLEYWRQKPMLYVSSPGTAIDVLIKREFAPAPERLQSVISRMRGVPAMLGAMRANISNPPREFTDLAIRIAEGSADFFETSIAEWAHSASRGDPVLLGEFETANIEVREAFKNAIAWLKTDLLPQSNGRYAIGAQSYSRKLLYEEMVDTPLDELLAIGEANLERDYRDFVETSRRIDPAKTPEEVMHHMAADHPEEDALLPATIETIDRIRQFIKDRGIVTMPSDIPPEIRETPPYARSGVFAMMDTPGAYETKAKEAYYYVTPTERNWDAKRKEEHLRLFNRPVMEIITIHEAYPGHYVQFLYANQFPTKTRRLLWCGTNAEGWAHYTEQMLLEEGYGNGDPKLRLAQLQEALLRDVRYVVGIKLHTQGMTVEEGARIFVEKGFQEPANAYEEARRGAYNPTYLYYTLGKLQIYKLREDYQKAKGAVYRLRDFHDAFVKQGGIPIKLLRRILLTNQDRSETGVL